MTAGMLVEARDLSRAHRRLRGEVVALPPVTAAFAPGTLTAVTGPSGAGKSTLLGLLGALDRPTGGDVLHDGVPLSVRSESSAAVLRRGIGFVFQSAAMIERMPLWENVTQSLVPQGVAARDRRATALRLLESVGIADLAARTPGEISGGERQRAALARALAASPRLVLADEPTANLDADTAALVAGALRAEASRGATVVVATHDPALVAAASAAVRLA